MTLPAGFQGGESAIFGDSTTSFPIAAAGPQGTFTQASLPFNRLSGSVIATTFILTDVRDNFSFLASKSCLFSSTNEDRCGAIKF